MLNFKGFDDWVEIFSGGPQTDSQGRAHDGDALIEKAVAAWDPAFHEPPAVVGHPRENAPAYGWVQAVKTAEANGKKVLLAKFRDVEPAFADLVRTGRFPKRSASFYPDGRLRHVGFLGAVPPAVKGLKNIQFTADEDAIDFEFADTRPWTWTAIAAIFRRLREYFIEKEGAERADAIIPEWNIEDVSEEARLASETPSTEEETMKFSEFMQALNIFKKLGGKDEDVDLIAPAAPSATPARNFSEADIEKAKTDAAEAAKQQAAADFAEKEKAAAKIARSARIAAWADGLIKDKKLPPALKDKGIVTFCEALDDAPIQFAEGAAKQAPLEWFKSFVEDLGESPLFAEMATKGAASQTADFKEAAAEVKLGQEIAATLNQQ